MKKLCQQIKDDCWTAAYELEGRNAIEEMKMICETVMNDPKFVEFYDKHIHTDDRLIRELHRFYRHGMDLDEAKCVTKALIKNDKKSKQELLLKYPGVRLIHTCSQDLAPNNDISPSEDSIYPTLEQRLELQKIYNAAEKDGIYDKLRFQLVTFLKEQSKDEIRKTSNEIELIFDKINEINALIQKSEHIGVWVSKTQQDNFAKPD